MEYIGGFLIALGLYRFGLFVFGIVRWGRRGELDRHSLLMLQVAAIHALGICLLGIAIWRARNESATLFGVPFIAAALSIGIATVIRLVDWFNRVRRPMDPLLIEAAFEAESFLDSVVKGDGGTSADERGKVEDVLRRLRNGLAPYRVKAAQSKR